MVLHIFTRVKFLIAMQYESHFMIRIIFISFLIIFSSTSCIQAKDVKMPIGSNIETIKIPDNWSYERIPYDETGYLYYFSDGKNEVKIINSKNDIINCASETLNQLVQCDKSKFSYRNVMSYSNLLFSCEDKICNDFVDQIKDRYQDKKDFIFDGQKFLLGENWRVINFSQDGMYEFYVIIYNNDIDQNFFLFKRKALTIDNAKLFLTNMGFAKLAETNSIADQLINNKFYFLYDNKHKSLINLKIGEHISFFGIHAEKEYLNSMKKLDTFVSDKEVDNNSYPQKSEYLISNFNEYSIISDGYNFQNIENNGECFRYSNSQEYFNFIKNNSHLKWEAIKYNNIDAMKVEYSTGASLDRKVIIYKMCLGKKTKTISNTLLPQTDDRFYDEIEEKLSKYYEASQKP